MSGPESIPQPRSMNLLQQTRGWVRWHIPPIAIMSSLVALGGWWWLGWPLLWPGLLALLLVAISVDGVTRASSSLFITTASHGSRGGNKVAITFDDGPDPMVTPAVLDTLAQYRARATFFVIGRTLMEQPALGRRIVAEGHVVANHTWQHSYFQNFRLWRWQTEEIARCERSIEEVTGRASTRLYRPPVGMKTGEHARAITGLGLKVIAWSVHSQDTIDPNPPRMARRVLKRVRSGDIILLHDGDRVPGQRSACVPALKLILEGLRKKGLESVTLTELPGLAPVSPP